MIFNIMILNVILILCLFITFYHIINQTALHLAVEKQNIDMIKILLTHHEINVNALYSIKY